MSSYIPGSGLKKPLNQLENPIQPDIKKGPPRFVWSRKNWKVDTGKTLSQVEHIPQLQESAILFQNRDYNSQHAYGKFSSRGIVVNQEFRPPMQDRDDFLPLSRIPRPVVVPRINPGAAFASGSAYAEQNMGISQVDKYITDRVKAGEIRPTFFAPISMPEDNSILPDLTLKLPATSASAGFKFPTIGIQDEDIKDLDYKQPQVAASAGMTHIPLGFQEHEVIELEYNRPQVAAGARENFSIGSGLTPINFDFDYKRPQVAAGAGFTPHSINNGFPTTELELDEKLEGNQPCVANPTFSPIYSADALTQDNRVNVDKSIMSHSYVVPHNTTFKSSNDDARLFHRQKPKSIGSQHGYQTKGHVPRAGIDTHQIKLKQKF